VPRLNGEPFLEKPPLVYWTIALSLKLFGIHDWAARLPAVFFGWGTLLFTGLLAQRIYGREAAAAALLSLATSVGFLVVSHHVESDAGLVFFVAASAYFLWRALHESSGWYGAASLAAPGPGSGSPCSRRRSPPGSLPSARGTSKPSSMRIRSSASWARGATRTAAT
jgi:4-amino-4-deoxy-L-arabinose transferase-like glycosyltransferase